MIINPGPQMGYSELVELYGEELGFSIGKTLRKAKGAVKTVAKAAVKNPLAVATGGVSLLAPKSVQKAVNKAVVSTAKVVARNPAAIATGGVSLLAPKSVQKTLNTVARGAATGGISLVATKSGRNLASKVARPVSHIAANAGRAALKSKLVKNTAGLAIKSFVPGGAAAMTAFDAAKSLNAKKRPAPMVAKQIAMPSAARTARPARSAAGQVGQARPFRPASAPAAPAALEPAPVSNSFPILPVAIGGAGLLVVLMMTMGKK